MDLSNARKACGTRQHGREEPNWTSVRFYVQKRNRPEPHLSKNELLVFELQFPSEADWRTNKYLPLAWVRVVEEQRRGIALAALGGHSSRTDLVHHIFYAFGDRKCMSGALLSPA